MLVTSVLQLHKPIVKDNLLHVFPSQTLFKAIIMKKCNNHIQITNNESHWVTSVIQFKLFHNLCSVSNVYRRITIIKR